MKPYYKSLLLIIFCSLFIPKESTAQQFASSFKPKNKTEKLMIAKLRVLPEIKEWFKTAKKSDPDLLIKEPDSTQKYYMIQVGLSNLDMFRTNYYLYVDPQTLQIYFWDEMVDHGHDILTLKQWRYWRTKPGWHEMHYYKNGKLLIVK